MRVLKRGTPPLEITHYATCSRCHSVMEFLRKEAKFVPCQRDGDYLEISCPVCHCRVTADAKTSTRLPASLLVRDSDTSSVM